MHGLFTRFLFTFMSQTRHMPFPIFSPHFKARAVADIYIQHHSTATARCLQVLLPGKDAMLNLVSLFWAKLAHFCLADVCIQEQNKMPSQKF